MPKRDAMQVFDEILRMADLLSHGDEQAETAQIASDLRQSGIDPDALKQRFHEAAQKIATRERTSGRPAPRALKEAISQTAPDGVVPEDEKSAESKMGHWIEKFAAPFALPSNLETARAYRKTGDISDQDGADLDELERKLKDEIKEQHEGKG